jgi:hypothetical protein
VLSKASDESKTINKVSLKESLKTKKRIKLKIRKSSIRSLLLVINNKEKKKGMNRR